MADGKLTERERRFVEAFMGPAAGNGTEAARLAGYKGSAPVLGVQSTRLLKKASVLAAIEQRRETLTDASIADAGERRRLLTVHARSGDNPAAAIKAIDTLNKMDGAYVEKHEHSGHLVTTAKVIHEHRPA
jgi:phage terminase small subunit